MSRRHFLQAGAGLGAMGLLPLRADDSASAAPRADHPAGVLFDHDELPRIRQSLTHPAFASYWDECRDADLVADRRFLTREVDLMNRVSDLARVANLALRSAFVHAIAPDPAHRDLAVLAVATALKFNRWDWILENDTDVVGVMRAPSVGVLLICAQDWLGDSLPPELRVALFQRLGDEVGPACHRAVRAELGAVPLPRWSMDPATTGLTRVDVSQWPKVLADTNLQIIASAGLIAVACSRPDHPAAATWRDLGIRSLRDFIAKQPPDGSFDEGSAYWGFTYNYFFIALEFLRRTQGIDLRNLADFPAMARYFLRATMPTHQTPRDCLSIGDCSNSGSVIPLAWIAREFRDSTAQHLLTRPGMTTTEPTLCWGAIWFDPSVSSTPAADLTPDYRLAPGLVVSRTGWSETDSVVCLRSGKPCNHEHADRNSLLFSAYGERLFNDPVKASYAPTHPRWLLRQTEAHSSVLINGQGHIYHHGEEGTNASPAHATLAAHHVALGWMSATSDATTAYQLAGHAASRVARTIVFLPPDLLLVFDAVDLDTPQSLEIRYQVHNDDAQGTVHAEGNGFEIRRPHARLQAQVASSSPIHVGTGKLDLPPAHGVYPFAAIRAEASRQHRILSLCSVHPSSRPPGLTHPQWRERDGTWIVDGHHHGRPFQIRLEGHPEAVAPTVSVRI